MNSTEFSQELLTEANKSPLACALLISGSIKDKEKKVFVQSLIADEYRLQGYELRAAEICSENQDMSDYTLSAADLQELSMLKTLLEKRLIKDALSLTRTWFDPYIKALALLEIHRFNPEAEVHPELGLILEEHLIILDTLRQRQRKKVLVKSASVYFSIGLSIGMLLVFLFILQTLLR